MMYVRGSTAIDVERDAETLERLFDEIMIAVNHLLYTYPFFACSDSYGYSMFVASAHEEHRAFLESEVAYIDIGRYIHACQVSDMHRTISIR